MLICTPKKYLSQLASVIGNKKEAQDWNNSVIGLADKINQRFYDDTKGYYYDKLLGKQEPVAVEGRRMDSFVGWYCYKRAGKCCFKGYDE